MSVAAIAASLRDFRLRRARTTCCFCATTALGIGDDCREETCVRRRALPLRVGRGEANRERPQDERQRDGGHQPSARERDEEFGGREGPPKGQHHRPLHNNVSAGDDGCGDEEYRPRQRNAVTQLGAVGERAHSSRRPGIGSSVRTYPTPCTVRMIWRGRPSLASLFRRRVM